MEEKSNPNKMHDWLFEEIKDWQEDKIITEDQVKTLRRRYEQTEATTVISPTHNKLIKILTILGVLLIGTGIIIFFAANWQKMENALKLAVIFISLIASYSLGYYWRYTPGKYPTLGAALILLGTIIFGAGILLVSQIYHLGGKLPTAIMFWGIGALLMAWTTELVPVLALSSLLFTTWSIMEIAESNPVYYYLAFMSLTFALAYRQYSKHVIVLNILGIGAWLWGAAFVWLSPYHSFYSEHIIIIIILYLFGILAYSAGYFNHFSSKTIGLAFWYRFIGLILLFIGIYFLSFKEMISNIHSFCERTKSMPNVLTGLTVLSIVTFLIVLSNILFKQSKTKSFRYEMIALIFLLFFIFLVLSYPVNQESASRYYHESPAIVYYSIFFNIVLFASIIGSIVMGYLNSEVSFIYLGLVAFIINLITRYVEYAWSMMDKSLFFVVGGIMLLASGYYMERLRRKLVERIKKEPIK
jgi:uncharacterized membrane protein